MSWSSRRATLVLTAIALLGGLTLLQVQAQRGKGIDLPAQPNQPNQPKIAPSYDLGRLSLPKNDDLKELLDAAEDRIKEKEYARAAELLQKLVGRTEDVFVPRIRKTPQGDSTLYVSVKREAVRVIGAMPKGGLDAYEVKYGVTADTAFKQARTNNNFNQMAQTVSLYLHTKAGAEATNWCAIYMMDRANFNGAANFYYILMQRSGLANLKEGQLVRAAYSFHQAGDPASQKYKADVLKELERRGTEFKLPSRDEPMSVADLKTSLDKFVVAISADNATDSPIYGGRPSRNAMLPGGTPFLEPSWREKMSTYRVRNTEKRIYEEAKDVTAETDKHLKTSIDALAMGNKHPISSFVPVTATLTKGEKKTPLLVYRDYNGITAINMTDGKVQWDSKLEWTFGTLYNDKKNQSNRIQAYTQWLAQWQQNTVRPQMPFDNSVTGTLAADNKHIYAIEDLTIPAPQNLLINVNQGWGGGMPTNNWGKDVNDALGYNKLVAMSAGGGSARWELGGTDHEDKRVVDSIFLGPPLPLNGKLYAVNEKQQEIRLLTIDPEKGKVVGLQVLATTKDLKLAHDPMRRVQAAHISHAEGILVIPTNGGAVFGVDLLSGSLAWAYPYGERPPVPPGANNPNARFQAAPAGWMWYNNQLVPIAAQNQWMVTAPRVQDGKAVFSAPDARDIHCINLRDGTRVWNRARQDDDLYVAGVFSGKVVIVGKTRTRALNLSNGNVMWELDTGLPSGMGAASTITNGTDVIYYLPIRQALNTREPEICAINVDKGIIHAHTRSRKGEVPGNLIFYEGSVLSQSHEYVTAYPQLEIKLTEMNNKLKDNADDLVSLTDRGDYLLDKGDLINAITDFRKTLRHANIGEDKYAATKTKVRTKLYEAYTEYFQRDFNKAETFLSDYEDVCKIDTANLVGDALTAAQTENRRRRANFLCLVGKGREAQNKLVDAFKHYLELGETSAKGELIQVVDEPSVKAAPDVWSQGRIASMVANAKAGDEKTALEAEIKSRWDKLKAKNNAPVGDLRNFVALFGSLFGVGKEARFALAERLMDDSDVNSLLEAEQHLTLLRSDASPPIAARALETLARINTRKGLLEDAAYYYRILADKYPKVDVAGKPAAEYLEDLATDKRFLPYLDQAGRYAVKGQVSLKSTEEKGSFYNYQTAYPLHNFGEQMPYYMRNRLMLDSGHNLKLVDSGSGDVRWSLRPTYTQFHSIAQGNSNASRAKFGYQTQGHLAIMTLGHVVFAVDPLNKGRIVWEKNLSSLPNSSTSAPYPMNANFPYDSRDGSVQVTYTDGSAQRLGGESGALQGGVVCLQTRDALTAVDPVTGRTLWTRTDVNSRAHVFGDEDHVYVVSMGENNSATSSRVFRAYDGVTVKVNDFAALYEKRIRLMGRNLLAADVDVKGIITLRIYDILAGKDLFKHTFPAGTMMMQSEDPRLAGVIEPGGVVKVIDVLTQKEVLNTKLQDPKHAPADARAIHLLSDPDYLFVAVNGKLDANVVAGTDFGPNYRLGQGMRSIPVNGEIYCFDRSSGKTKWFDEVQNQHLIITQFEELPCLFFTARYQKWVGQAAFRQPTNVTTAWAVAKHNGKMWWMPDNADKSVDQNLYFHGVSMDHRTGKVELIGDSKKMHLTATPK